MTFSSSSLHLLLSDFSLNLCVGSTAVSLFKTAVMEALCTTAFIHMFNIPPRINGSWAHVWELCWNGVKVTGIHKSRLQVPNTPSVMRTIVAVLSTLFSLCEIIYLEWKFIILYLQRTAGNSYWKGVWFWKTAPGRLVLTSLLSSGFGVLRPEVRGRKLQPPSSLQYNLWKAVVFSLKHWLRALKV